MHALAQFFFIEGGGGGDVAENVPNLSLCHAQNILFSLQSLYIIALAPMWSIARLQFSSTVLCPGLGDQFGSIVDLFAAVLNLFG